MKLVAYAKIKSIYLILLIFIGSKLFLFAQDAQIGGVINLYKHVTEIDPIGNRVGLNDVSELNVGDTVVLIQMKGGIMYATNEPFGNLYEYSGTPGMHEFLIIESISSPYVTFTRSIKNSFDADNGLVQLIKVPYYNSATVTSTLTCDPWNGETGGVLVFVVGSTLSLNANINVSGKGFKGGESVAGNGDCVQITDNPLYYPNTANNAGGKGEGIANYVWTGVNILPLLPDYAMGRGVAFTGGGGGNGRYAGGGGGAGWGGGGMGGNQDGCPAPGQGLGGLTILNTDIDFNNNLFMGSGGGGSTYSGAGISTFGASGGGIIIIICDTLKGNGNIIAADGGSPNVTVTGDAGAGGGGGGGSIALYVHNYALGQTGAVTLSAIGGKGGNTTNYFGEGGGGGGGVILTNGATPLTVLKLVSRGERGDIGIGTPSGSAGEQGKEVVDFIPALNGFLYNTVFSKVTGNQIDSICSNVSFEIIAGTTPLDGTIQWQKAEVLNPVETDYTDIAGATEEYYLPEILSQTTWFRRVVTTTSGDFGAVTDESEPVQIIVHPSIKDNIIGDPDTLCYGQNAKTLISRGTLQDGNGIYNYSWTLSSDGITFIEPTIAYISEDYTHEPALTETTWYRRTVTSGRCVDVSDPVKIMVLTLTDNVISSKDTTLCMGGTPSRLIGATPIDGTNVPRDYTYSWQFSTDNSNWHLVDSDGSNRYYDPPALDQTTWYKRIAISNVCESVSDNAVKVTVLQPVSNNTLNNFLEICEGYVPVRIMGSSPEGGDGVYNYSWVESSDNGITWSAAYGIYNDPSGAYQPPALNIPMMYKRMVLSGLGNCCIDTSNVIEIQFHPLPSSSVNAGPDTVLYSFDRFYQMKASPVFPYETGEWSVISGSGSFDSDQKYNAKVTNLSPKLNTFQWTVTNGPCISKAIVNVTVKDIFIPNGFSPNNDDVNDEFEILGLDLVNQYAELSIVNSAGTEVFHTSNRNGQKWNNWDGKTSSGVDLAESTYYYKLTLESKNTDVSPYTVRGFIVLKRK